MRFAVSSLLLILVLPLTAPAQDNPCSLEECTITGFGSAQRVLWIPNLPGPVNHRWFFDQGGGTFETFSDGTAHIYGNTFNEDAPEYELYIDIWFTDRMNWAEWSALGRGWKGNATTVGDLYTNWDYYIMHPDSANRLSAGGAWEGTLDVTHMPSNYYFGLQVGEAANDQNGAHGMSTWMEYTGTLDGAYVEGNADINGEGGCEPLELIDCVADVTVECGDSTDPSNTGTPEILCPEMSLDYEDITSGDCPLIITRTWTVTTTVGETATCTQTITVEDTTPPAMSTLPELSFVDCGETISPAWPTATDACSGETAVTVTTEAVPFEVGMCGQFRTQTPGGWGSSASGDNPGTYRDAHFDAAFPNGLTIGCANTLTLTSSAAVEAFLPAGGTPAALPPGDMVDPAGYTNALAQHLVALKLTLGFDAYDPDFAGAYASMTELVLGAGELAGTTLQELIDQADAVIGGCSTELTPSQITGALTIVNENYVDGTNDQGQVDCPYADLCGELTVFTFTATDDCGNTATAQQLVGAIDTEGPTILTDLQDITVECGQVPEPFIEVDGCGDGAGEWAVEVNSFSGTCLPTLEYVYTVTDACGNALQANQFITVIDTEAPVFLNAPEDLNIACGDPIPPFTPEVSDACDEAVDVAFSESISSTGCGQLVIHTWTAMDACGNTASVSRTITQIDDAGPQPVSPLNDAEVSCDGALTPATPEFADACSAVVDVQVEVALPSEECGATGLYIWTALDACGNSTVIVQNVTVVDTDAPVFAEAPTSFELMCGDALPAATLTAIDNCSGVDLTYEDVEMPTEACAGVVRTYTALDACGNVATFTQTFTFVDSEAPELSAYPSNVDGSCTVALDPPVITATDNCDAEVEVSLAETITPLDCGIQMLRTWTATDQCGNTVSHTQSLTLSDTAPPIFSGEAVVTASCVMDPISFINVTDDCDPNVELSFTETQSGDFCGQTLERVYTATDNCGNSSTFTQTVELFDNQPPNFVYVPEDQALVCSDGIPPVSNPIVEDDCNAVTVTLEETEEGSGCQQLLRRTWTATDACGNSAQAEQVLYIGDQLAPELQNVPADLALDCAAALPDPAVVTAADDCGDVEVLFTEETLDGACANTFTVVRTWTAIDACGNSASASQTIAFIDTTPPVFDAEVEDIIAQCGEIPLPPVVFASDDCSTVMIDLVETFETGGCPNIIRTWTATDACGNAAVLVQSVQVEDNEPPVLEGIISVINTTCNNIPDLPDPEVSDNCDDEVAVTYTENIIGTGCEITIIRTWIASDDCGNTTVVSQSVNLTDEEAPVFVTAPVDMTVECSALGNVPLPNVIDDCGATVVMSYQDQALGIGCEYDIARTWTAMDACGNTASAVQTLHVIDQTPPVIAGISPNIAVTCDNIPVPAEPVVTDACSDIADVTFTEVQLGTGCSYTLQRTWTATDACGNASSIARLIFVEDGLSPYFVGVPEDIQLACLTDEVPEAVHPQAMDNCTAAPEVTFIEFSEALACGEVITRRWLATDDCGNTATAQQQVFRTDSQAPVISGVPEPVQVSCDNIPVPAEVTADDACGDSVLLMFEEDVDGGQCPYTITRTWTAVDGCGNTAISIQQIEVTDLVAPALVNTPDDTTVSCGQVPDPTDVHAVDNCSDVAVLLEEEWLETGCVSLLQRTWTATDLCGNAAQHVQLIEVLDDAAPAFTAYPEDMMIQCGDPELLVHVDIADDCAGGSIEFNEERLDTECSSEFTLLRTWTATDACGNASTIQQVVEVVDSYAPVWQEAPDDLVVTCEEIPPMPEVIVDGECDDDVEIFVEETITELGEIGEHTCDLGNTVTDFATVALWLPGLPAEFGENYVFNQDGGSFVQDFEAGTAHITGQVYNAAYPLHSWIIDIHLEDRKDWDAWSEAGGGYKDDYGVAGELYKTWSYYKLSENSQLIGAYDFEGSVLSLTHAPANFEFGFQVGEAANNRNAEWGMSGWFFYEGTLQGIPVTGMGDVMTENACCADQDILRTWTITDCAGNASTYTQLIEVRQDIPLEPLLITEDEEQAEVDSRSLDVFGTEGDWFRVAFTPEVDGDYVLTICNEQGRCVEMRELKGLKAGQRQVWAQPKEGLPSGAYVITMAGQDRKYSDRELVLR